MPAESEVGNGQVPQLQVQNEDNETVIIQNGGPKKVEKIENQSSDTENSKKNELKKVEISNQSTESVSDEQKEVEKVEAETDQAEPEQCQLKQVEVENQIFEPEPETIEQCELDKAEIDENEPICPLRSTVQVEETKVEEQDQDQDEDVPCCPLRPSSGETKVEDVKTTSHLDQEILLNGSHKKVSMFTTLDADTIKAAYDDVRSDGSETEWAVFKFEGSRIALSATGSEFEKFREQFTENERGFGYIRIQTGDEMSKRQKFLFITWIGPGVSVIQRAKMSTDKALIKGILSNFAVELQLENESDFDLKHFVAELNKAGGANYGTGIRDF